MSTTCTRTSTSTTAHPRIVAQREAEGRCPACGRADCVEVTLWRDSATDYALGIRRVQTSPTGSTLHTVDVGDTYYSDDEVTHRDRQGWPMVVRYSDRNGYAVSVHQHAHTHGPDSHTYTGSNGAGYYVSVCGRCGAEAWPVCTG